MAAIPCPDCKPTLAVLNARIMFGSKSEARPVVLIRAGGTDPSAMGELLNAGAVHSVDDAAWHSYVQLPEMMCTPRD